MSTSILTCIRLHCTVHVCVYLCSCARKYQVVRMVGLGLIGKMPPEAQVNGFNAVPIDRDARRWRSDYRRPIWPRTHSHTSLSLSFSFSLANQTTQGVLAAHLNHAIHTLYVQTVAQICTHQAGVVGAVLCWHASISIQHVCMPLSFPLSL